MTSDALTDALRASQAKAVAALGKAYIRRDDEPDDELFRALLLKIGLDDEVAIGFLLQGWSVLREYREPAPAEQQAPKQLDAEASPAQMNLLRKLADEKGVALPDRPFTKQRAHEAIDALKAGTFNPDEWEVPF
jgi:hypothetical protein